jgi:hypothetical protein
MTICGTVYAAALKNNVAVTVRYVALISFEFMENIYVTACNDFLNRQHG